MKKNKNVLLDEACTILEWLAAYDSGAPEGSDTNEMAKRARKLLKEIKGTEQKYTEIDRLRAQWDSLRLEGRCSFVQWVSIKLGISILEAANRINLE